MSKQYLMTMKSNDKNLHQELLNKSIQLLAQRNHSSVELKNKLLRFISKKIENEDSQEQITTVIEQVVIHCNEKNWINDLDYTEQYIHMRSNKGYGRQRITTELNQRGINREIINQVINTIDVNWIEVGIKTANKKNSQINKADPKQKMKLFQFLTYRGFTNEEIKEIYQLL